MAVRGRDGEGIAEAEAVELGGEVGVAGLIDLVGDHRHGRRAAAQDLRDFGVSGAKARAGIDHEHHQVGVVDRGPRLGLNRPRQRVLGGKVDATGVDESERTPFHSQSSALRSRVTPASE